MDLLSRFLIFYPMEENKKFINVAPETFHFELAALKLKTSQILLSRSFRGLLEQRINSEV